MSRLRVLVSGGTGFVGRALIGRLCADGHDVTAWVRDVARAAAALGPAVRLVPLTDDGLDDGLVGADAVINLAGAPILGVPWTERRADAIRASRVSLCQRISDGLNRCSAPPSVVVGASAVGIYGDLGEGEGTEESPPGDGYLAELCVDWEAALRVPAGVRSVSARLGVVLGPGGGALGAMLGPARFGLAGRLGTGRQWVPWISLGDAVSAIVCAVQSPALDGPVNLVSPHPVRQAALARAVGAAVGRGAQLPTPAWAVRAALGPAAAVLLDSQRVQPGALVRVGFSFDAPQLSDALALAIPRR